MELSAPGKSQAIWRWVLASRRGQGRKLRPAGITPCFTHLELNQSLCAVLTPSPCSQPHVLAPAPNFPMPCMSCFLWMSCDCSTAQLFGMKTFPLHSPSLIYPPCLAHSLALTLQLLVCQWPLLQPAGCYLCYLHQRLQGKAKLCLLSWMTLLTFCHRIY